LDGRPVLVFSFGQTLPHPILLRRHCDPGRDDNMNSVRDDN
jgi:hypothetical protein